MGGSETGPDDGLDGGGPFAVQYRTVHTLEVVIPHPPGGGVPGRDLAAAQQQLRAAVAQYGRTPGYDEFSLDVVARGKATLSCVVGVERGQRWAAAGPVPAPAQATPVSDDGLHVGGAPVVTAQADGMDMGPGFGRAGGPA